MSAGPNGKPTINWVSGTLTNKVVNMRFLTFFVIYTISLAPIAALVMFVSDSASAQIISSFETVINVLETLNASII